jgi:hypothetical protein
MSLKIRKILLVTACKQYYLAAGATQGNIAYTQNVSGKFNAPHNRQQQWQNDRQQKSQTPTF